jgi:hypothetical protein
MKTLTQNYLSLAAYNYKRAVYHAANNDTARALKNLETARQYDKFAREEAS